MKNYHILKVNYLGPTETRGSRIKISSERFNCSVQIPYNYAFNNALDGACEWLRLGNWDIIGTGEGKGHSYIITDTFKALK